jgi:hypothetical protein
MSAQTHEQLPPPVACSGGEELALYMRPRDEAGLSEQQKQQITADITRAARAMPRVSGEPTPVRCITGGNDVTLAAPGRMPPKWVADGEYAAVYVPADALDGLSVAQVEKLRRRAARACRAASRPEPPAWVTAETGPGEYIGDRREVEDPRFGDVVAVVPKWHSWRPDRPEVCLAVVVPEGFSGRRGEHWAVLPAAKARELGELLIATADLAEGAGR